MVRRRRAFGYLPVWIAMTGLLGCFPLVGPHAPDRRRDRPRKIDSEDVAHAMVRLDAFLVVTPDHEQMLVRRCSRTGDADTCEVTRVVGKRPVESLPATSIRSQLTDAAVEKLRSAAQVWIDDVDGMYWAITRRVVKAGDVPGLTPGSTYRFAVRGGLLTLSHRALSTAQFETRVALLRVTEPVRVSAYVNHSHYGLFALQLHHGLEDGPSSTSWVIFEQRGSDPGGQTWVIPSTTGQHGVVVSGRPSRVAIPPKPEPSPSIAVQADATTDSALVEPPVRACNSEQDCRPAELCQSPEEHTWNACGAPSQPACGAGFIGDDCGHCFEACETNEDCDAKRCNGSYCVSPPQCGPLEERP